MGQIPVRSAERISSLVNVYRFRLNSGAVDIIRTAYYILGLELMKLIFAVLDV